MSSLWSVFSLGSFQGTFRNKFQFIFYRVDLCPGASRAAFKSTFPAWDSQRSSKAKSRTRPWTCGRAQAGPRYQMSLSSSWCLTFKFPKHFLTFTHSFDICSNPLWQLGPEYLSQFYWWVKWGLKRWNKWLEMKVHMYICWLKSIREILGTAWEAQSRVSVLVSLSYWTCYIYLYVNCWALARQSLFSDFSFSLGYVLQSPWGFQQPTDRIHLC